MALEEEKKENQNEGAKDLLNEKHKKEMSEILVFGEKYKEEGERMKKEFWKNCELPDKSLYIFRTMLNERDDREKIKNLIKEYESNKKIFMELLPADERSILNRVDEMTKKKIYEDYLHDKIFYSGKIKDEEVKDVKEYNYEDWKQGVEIGKGVKLNLRECHIGNEGAEEISKIQLKEGVILDLCENDIGFAGAKAISKMELKDWVTLNLGSNNLYEGLGGIPKMKLKKGVTLDLGGNGIGDEGAVEISEMELKEGVRLCLDHNDIGDEGIEAISKMELKEGVALDLTDNYIGLTGAKAISKMGLKDGVALIFARCGINDECAEEISKIELKEGATLDLGWNKIGDEGAEAIMKMELKDGVVIDLSFNNISKKVEGRLRRWCEEKRAAGINCQIIL